MQASLGMAGDHSHTHHYESCHRFLMFGGPRGMERSGEHRQSARVFTKYAPCVLFSGLHAAFGGRSAGTACYNTVVNTRELPTSVQCGRGKPEPLSTFTATGSPITSRNSQGPSSGFRFGPGASVPDKTTSEKRKEVLCSKLLTEGECPCGCAG
jgi:hypothetical protein